MNTPLKNKKDIQQAFNDVLNTDSAEEKVELETLVLSAKFLSEIERIRHERGILKKELAEMIGTSPSHVTQLFRGDKTINLKTIAKLQLALGISFDIKISDSRAETVQKPQPRSAHLENTPCPTIKAGDLISKKIKQQKIRQ